MNETKYMDELYQDILEAGDNHHILTEEDLIEQAKKQGGNKV